MKIHALLLLIGFAVAFAHGADEKELPSATDKERALIEAAFHLKLDTVRDLLEEGVDVNARYGDHGDSKLFGDPWTLSWPLASGKWTALMALANSNRYPDPPRLIQNTEADHAWALREMEKIPGDQVRYRNITRMFIAKELVEHGSRLNDHDGKGGSPLNFAIEEGFDDLALLLIDSGANVNEVRGVYIDGPGKVSVVHTATGSPRVLAAVILAGAKLDVQDTDGDTPLHDAVMRSNLASVMLLVDAGADDSIKNSKGRTPLDLISGPGLEHSEDRLIKSLLTKHNDIKHNKSPLPTGKSSTDSTTIAPP